MTSEKPKKALYKRWWVWLIAVIALIIIASQLGGNSTPTATEPDASGTSQTQAGETAAPEAGETTAPEEPAEASADGTRGNPFPIGTEIEGKDWTVVVNSVNLDASGEIMDANPFNTEPADGETWIIVNYTLTYTGSDEGNPLTDIEVEYVTPGGISVSNGTVVGHDGVGNFTDLPSSMFPGASHTIGNAFLVPSDGAGDGVVSIKIGFFGGDKIFVAAQ